MGDPFLLKPRITHRLIGISFSMIMRINWSKTQGNKIAKIHLKCVKVLYKMKQELFHVFQQCNLDLN